MADLNVRIEQLPRMWVACVRAFGESPEDEAWHRLRDWAIPQGLFDDVRQHPIFGFNNPSPSADRKEYGYELWIRVDEPVTGPAPVTFKEFHGGLFAVSTSRLHAEGGVIAAWRKLWEWAQTGRYRWRHAQELERVLNPSAAEDELLLELYLPVEESTAAQPGSEATPAKAARAAIEGGD